jgi:hypothetical protein
MTELAAGKDGERDLRMNLEHALLETGFDLEDLPGDGGTFLNRRTSDQPDAGQVPVS